MSGNSERKPKKVRRPVCYLPLHLIEWGQDARDSPEDFTTDIDEVGCRACLKEMLAEGIIDRIPEEVY